MGGMSLVKKGKDQIVFKAHPLQELFIEDDDVGKGDVVFRESTLTARQFATRFKDSEIPEVERAIKKDNPEARFKVVQLVARSNDPYAGDSSFSKPWTSVFKAC